MFCRACTHWTNVYIQAKNIALNRKARFCVFPFSFKHNTILMEIIRDTYIWVYSAIINHSANNIRSHIKTKTPHTLEQKRKMYSIQICWQQLIPILVYYAKQMSNRIRNSVQNGGRRGRRSTAQLWLSLIICNGGGGLEPLNSIVFKLTFSLDPKKNERKTAVLRWNTNSSLFHLLQMFYNNKTL